MRTTVDFGEDCAPSRKQGDFRQMTVSLIWSGFARPTRFWECTPIKSTTCSRANGILIGYLPWGNQNRAARQRRRGDMHRILKPALGIWPTPFHTGSPVLSVSRMSEVTQVLSAIEQGDPLAAEQLLPLVYGELRKLAAQKLAQEKPGQTLQATALVHDAYLRLVDTDKVRNWNSRGHFFAAAAEAMRRILVENVRRKRGPKRGGDRQRVDLEEALSLAESPSDEVLAIDEALTRLEQIDPTAAKLVKLRYFAGLTMPQAAEALGVSLRHAERNWTYARTWLHRALDVDDPPAA
jgi:RNA polymerase sigma factor (TIGR02999 family)